MSWQPCHDPQSVPRKGIRIVTTESVSRAQMALDRVNLVRPVLPQLDEFADEVREILESGMVTKGQQLEAFEAAVADHLGVEHAIAVSSCTTGMMLIHRGLGLTGEAIVPSFTFMATVSAVVWAGLTPVFVDVDPETYNLDPARVEAAITSDTSVIVAVHQFGNPADVEALEAIATRRGLALVFDAAHGFGARYQGVPVGRQGTAQSFSLSPTKLVIAGEGGIVATKDATLAARVRMGREYGNRGDYNSALAGMNARMPEFNALLGRHSLRRVEEAAERRNAVATLFRRGLGDLPGLHFQRVRDGDRHSYKDFSLRVDGEAFGLSRDDLASALNRAGIDTRNYYDPPVHRHDAYRQFAGEVDLPVTERLAAGSVSIPVWSHMTDEIAARITGAIQDACERGHRARG